MMAEVAKDSYTRQYSFNKEPINRSLEETNIDLYLGYADSLAKCGKLEEAFKVYSHCYRIEEIPVDKLKLVTNCLLEAVLNVCDISVIKNTICVYRCGICEGVLRQPVTTPCGHTFCKKCLSKDPSRSCWKCGQRLMCGLLETNIIVKNLVEKFWSAELVASKLREEGNALFHRNEVEAALAKYNDALLIVPDDHLVLSNRSHALHSLGRLQSALADAELVIRLRPLWGKGYFRKGTALASIGRYEDALVSLCTFVALDRNPQLVRHDLARIIHLLLTPKHRPRCPPYGNTCMRKSRFFNRSLSSVLDTSDCEYNSSDEEELTTSTGSLPSIHDAVDRVFVELDRLKRVEYKPLEMKFDGLLLDRSDFDCVLCCRTLLKPVTTPCGHTYCLSCLDRSLDYSSSCALCMKSLADYITVAPKNVTEFIEKILKTYYPTEYLTRQITYKEDISQLIPSNLEKQPRIPVFVCTTAYPHVPCPLFIYEPRYRLMIRRCLEAGIRQFGIAACVGTDTRTRRFADYGTILDIKDRVLMPDGCSILATVGVRRFRTQSRSECDGYDTARIEVIHDDKLSITAMPVLKELHSKVRLKAAAWVETFTKDFKDQIMCSFGAMPEIEDDWMTLQDGPAWAWWMLAILPLGPQLQVGILGTTSLEKRLRAIDKTLTHIQQRLTVQLTETKTASS